MRKRNAMLLLLGLIIAKEAEVDPSVHSVLGPVSRRLVLPHVRDNLVIPMDEWRMRDKIGYTMEERRN